MEFLKVDIDKLKTVAKENIFEVEKVAADYDSSEFAAYKVITEVLATDNDTENTNAIKVIVEGVRSQILYGSKTNDAYECLVCMTYGIGKLFSGVNTSSTRYIVEMINALVEAFNNDRIYM